MASCLRYLSPEQEIAGGDVILSQTSQHLVITDHPSYAPIAKNPSKPGSTSTRFPVDTVLREYARLVRYYAQRPGC